MTYKMVVEEIVREDAVNWFEGLLRENGYEGYAITENVKLEKEKERINWTVKISHCTTRKTPGCYKIKGCIGEFGIQHILIRDLNEEIIWTNTKEANKELGIKEFKVR